MGNPPLHDAEYAVLVRLLKRYRREAGLTQSDLAEAHAVGLEPLTSSRRLRQLAAPPRQPPV